MPESLPDRCQNVCQIECQNRCQIECQNVCQTKCRSECQKRCQMEYHNICQIECPMDCQKICQIRIPDGMSECMSDRMSLCGGHSKKVILFSLSMFGPFPSVYFHCLDMFNKHNVFIIVGFSSPLIPGFDFFKWPILSPVLFLFV